MSSLKSKAPGAALIRRLGALPASPETSPSAFCRKTNSGLRGPAANGCFLLAPTQGGRAILKTALFALGLTMSVAACKPASNVDIAAEEAAIRAKETAWMAAYNKHDAAGLAAQYQDDAGLAGPGIAIMTDPASR